MSTISRGICSANTMTPESPALHQAYPDGRRETYSFRDLDELSNQVANALRERGIESGDRVAIVVPQKPANPLTHPACWKLGAISLPLSVLFGPDALDIASKIVGRTWSLRTNRCSILFKTCAKTARS